MPRVKGTRNKDRGVSQFILIHDVLIWNRESKVLDISLAKGMRCSEQDLELMRAKQTVPPGTEFLHPKTGMVIVLEPVGKKVYREGWLEKVTRLRVNVRDAVGTLEKAKAMINGK